MRSSERTSSASPHICYFSNEKSNICGEHFDPYGVLPLIFFLLKISILISQPFDLYSCFFLTIEYWRLFFSSLFWLFFFPDLFLFSVSGGSFRLKVCKEQVWWMLFARSSPGPAVKPQDAVVPGKVWNYFSSPLSTARCCNAQNSPQI